MSGGVGSGSAKKRRILPDPDWQHKNMFYYPGYDDHDAGGLTARGLLLARPGPEA